MVLENRPTQFSNGAWFASAVSPLSRLTNRCPRSHPAQELPGGLKGTPYGPGRKITVYFRLAVEVHDPLKLDRLAVIERGADQPQAVKAGIVAMARVSDPRASNWCPLSRRNVR